jgi:hypothetical protein
MGDTHFLLRHAIVGAIFLLFGWIGWWIVDSVDAWAFLYKQIDGGTSAALSAAVTSPIIGITIQGMRILWIHRRRGGVFTDDGRKVVAEKMREIFKTCRQGPTVLSVEVWDTLTEASDDSLFVWLYHRSAPVDLIEWARRRRSYHYLGVNLVYASAGGLVAGGLAPLFDRLPPIWEGAVILIIALAWCAGAWFAAELMRRDVDRMELLWAAARVDRELKRCLETAFGTLIDETFAGSDPARQRPQP